MNAIAQSGGTEEPAATGSVSYVWGKDLSGAWQGAGGVGGLLAVRRDGAWFFPLYDNNGNITEYVDENGAVVAHYAYDAFGNTIGKSGALADTFRFRFSTKYDDAETGLYYYGYRYYAPELMRWICRDPIEEGGGINLYAFCGNNDISRIDNLGNGILDVRAERIRAYILHSWMKRSRQMKLGYYIKVSQWEVGSLSLWRLN